MKVITHLLLLLITCVSNFGCKSIKDQYPKDFGFKMESIIEVINSFDSTYQRSYREGDSIVKIQICATELKDIYNSIIKNGLDRYPDNYSPTCELFTMPTLETKLQFRINGEYKNLKSMDDCRNGFFTNKKNAKINKSIKRIEEIVRSKPEVKRLSNTNIILL